MTSEAGNSCKTLSQLCCNNLILRSQALSEEQVAHFDLKCDNVLLEPLPGVDEEAFWAPVSDQLPFEVVLADFGDSCDFSCSDHKFTTR